GPGVRWDGGIELGSEIGLYYDPMLAKLIVWAPDRAQAITRMRRALVDLVIGGIESSRDFHVRVMDDEEFRRGAIDIQWLERRLPEILARSPSDDTMEIAAIAGALLAERDRSARSVSVDGSPTAQRAHTDANDSWKQAARAEGLRT
ncbi:MAG TPA: acetyl-CoA carboxylase biotin carboxylase subunit, partial [Gemmatimonadaceae bacterium]|nr:acetyl-CoA carboxylase biotin carboxylase subunit [Gemmatimonadaceae bacterium]